MRRSLGTASFLFVATAIGVASAQDVVGSKHNLSASGQGTIRASAESQVCIFCHAPHNAAPQAPLWNRRDPGGQYDTYTSTTLKVAPGQPSGASRLCLSCHDGTIALGEVISRPADIGMVGPDRLPAGSRSTLGTDLRDDHPVSFGYSTSLGALGTQLRANPTLSGRSLLDAQGQVQCTSCHDPHDDSYGKFLRTDPRYAALCNACHSPAGWDQSDHATSGRTWNGTGTDPWPTSDLTSVRENGCENCHVSHKAGGQQRLLRSSADETVCLACHSGTVATKDIAAELTKFRAHDPTLYTGVHDPAEVPNGRSTHVECADCHNPHQANSTPASGSGVSGALRGVSGLSSSGTPLSVATYEYEVCYKCHADDAASNPDRIPRLDAQANIRKQFDPGNVSFHPVETAGRNADVPSLKSPYTTASRITCTDCHNNDAGSGGTNGPHGSRWSFLLERRYETSLPTVESSAVYALCYKCHSRQSILDDRSFDKHKKHIDEDIPCASCHAAHGVESNSASSGGDHTHLINFDSRVVFPNSRGVIEFVDEGRFQGNCSMLCHGEDHDQEDY